MEWIRRRSKSEYRGEGKKWNQKILSNIGKGPTPPTDDEGKSHVTAAEARDYARMAKMSMRITSGYRTGIVAGGPQGEAPNIRAAKVKGSVAEMIMTGGCKGCIARGCWPGATETTGQHTCTHARED